jgi:multiple antibiotic resistance protein
MRMLMDNLSLLTIVLTLFLIMDPIGNISSFLAMTDQIGPRRQKFVILRELFFALFFMFLFNYIGETLLIFLELSPVSLRLSSGVILFLVAIKLLFPAENSFRNNLPSGEPFLIPLAIPLIAGPSLLATIMLYTNLETCKKLMFAGILFSWMLAVVVLLLGPQLNRLLGKNGLMACERLMAMVLVMLAIQRFMEGMAQFIHNYP